MTHPASLPVIRELPRELNVHDALARLADLPGCLLLHSGVTDRRRRRSDTDRDRYSFLVADPFETIRVPVGARDPLADLGDLMRRFTIPDEPSQPPFQGGIAGLFGYELNRSLESLPSAMYDEFGLPALATGAYDLVVAWDHVAGTVQLTSQGFPETDPALRRRRAVERADQFTRRLTDASRPPSPVEPVDQLNRAELCPQFSTDHYRWPELTSNLSRDQYLARIERAVDYIHGGDVFQINLAQRLLHPSTTDSQSLFRRLCHCNPAPFSAYFDLTHLGGPPAQVVSASPERLISVRGRRVETRPIKGTRRRTGNPRVDLRECRQLMASEKDRAENTMIVDLMRNDLSLVCDDDSIQVTQWCELETYQSVFHLVSAVQGRLGPDRELVDLLAAVFPGGSITGAPKIRAMEIIAELEPTVRGAYCGSLGYLGFNGAADLNILIRTMTAARGWWQIPVGGGIVAQSRPLAEYEETWAKAAGMLQAMAAASDPETAVRPSGP